MPTRKVSDRERLTIFARTATDDELEAALEILRVEAQVRKATRPTGNTAKKATKKPEKAVLPTRTEGDNEGQ